MSQLTRSARPSIIFVSLFIIDILPTGAADPPAYKPEIPYHQSRYAFPTDQNRLNELGRIIDLDAHRELSDANREYILDLSDYLIDKRHNEGARETAARYLGIYGHSIAIPALLAVSRDEEDDIEVRMRAILALAHINDKRVVMWIIEEGFGSDNDNLIIAARDALAGSLSDVPPELKHGDYLGNWGFRLPPGFSNSPEKSEPADAEKLEAYLDIWREWWRKNHEKVTLSRPIGIP